MKTTRIEANEITEEQKKTIILDYGMTFDDVDYYTVQRWNGQDVIYAHYIYKEINGNNLIDGLQMLCGNKHSKAYRAAKKRLGVTNDQVNSARKLVK